MKAGARDLLLVRATTGFVSRLGAPNFSESLAELELVNVRAGSFEITPKAWELAESQRSAFSVLRSLDLGKAKKQEEAVDKNIDSIFWTRSGAQKLALDLLRDIDSDRHIVLVGSQGTGKSIMARVTHYLSS